MGCTNNTSHIPPGKPGDGTESDVIMMICTAGHVDHGKTELVKLLTGCITDRLKVEQERGLTIELGFAPCVLGDGVSLGIVDVPGHEKFVRNMVSGVSGIEMTVLVIAANDGIMPQTIEHFQIMELLGVTHGMVALTKIDMVTRDRLHTVTEEIREYLKGSFMENAPICPVSSKTFEGYSEFYTTLVKQALSLSRRRKYGIFRMPVAQVFTRMGFGIVAMGIPVDGSIAIGDRIEVVPGNQTGRVRAVQQFSRDTSDGEYGQCLGLNIPDFNKKPPSRGQVISLPEYLKPAHSFHVRLETVSNLQRPLRNAEEVKFHTGTSEEPGKIYLLENTTADEGETILATIVLPNPIVAAAHDRFIIRRPSPSITIAGGEILAVSGSAHKPRKNQIAEKLHSYTAFFHGIDPAGDEGIEKKIEYVLTEQHTGCSSPKELSIATLLIPDVVKQCLANLADKGKALSLGSDCYIHTDNYSKFLEEAEARLQSAVSEDGVLSLTMSDFRSCFDWPDRLWNKILDDLQARDVITLQGSKLVLRDAFGKLDENDRSLMERVQDSYEKSGFHSPRPDELPDLLQVPEKRVVRTLEYLYIRGKLVKLSRNVVISYDNFRNAQNMVVTIINEKGSLDSADFKHHIGSTRKYALAVLDFLDSQKVTVRRGNTRILAEDYRRYLL